MGWRRVGVLAVATSLAAAGLACGGRAIGTAPMGAQPFSGRELTAGDLRQLAGARNLLDGIARLRPSFLMPRRGPDAVPAVYVNGVRVAAVAALREVGVDEVSVVRFLDPSEATIRYGTGHGGGVVEVLLLAPRGG